MSGRASNLPGNFFILAFMQHIAGAKASQGPIANPSLRGGAKDAFILDFSPKDNA